MKLYAPTQLSDLATVFNGLERGESAVLIPRNARGCASQVPLGGESKMLGLWSSGTSGAPKLVWHGWDNLKRTVSYRGAPQMWISPFEPWTYAGVQVALQAWATGRPVISLTSDWAHNWQLIARLQPDAISATPTCLDFLLRAEQDTRWTPRQITIGGEPVSIRLGTRLRRRFPSARFTAIYASTELGVVMKSRRVDGWYPAVSLESRFRGWRVHRGVLRVHNGWGWQSTGDLVELQGHWIRVVGRANQSANIGGFKVMLTDVSDRALEVAGVQSASAFAQASTIGGQIVGLRFAVEPGYAAAEVRAALEDHLRATLPKPAWPRCWEIAGPVLVNAKSVGTGRKLTS